MVPRHGSIYDRLDKARAQRMKSLSPQIAANSEPPKQARQPSKSNLLPTIKSQEDFEPIVDSGLPGFAKLGMGLLAFAIMAGFTLLGWGTQQPQTTITAPAELNSTPTQTNLPDADAPARVSDADFVGEATAGSLPVIPSVPSKAVVVEVQQDAAPLIVPDASAQGAQDP